MENIKLPLLSLTIHKTLIKCSKLNYWLYQSLYLKRLIQVSALDHYCRLRSYKEKDVFFLLIYVFFDVESESEILQQFLLSLALIFGVIGKNHKKYRKNYFFKGHIRK